MIEDYKVGSSKLRIDIAEPPTPSRFAELKKAAKREASATKGRLYYTGLGTTGVAISNQDILESGTIAEAKLPCGQDTCTRKLIIDKAGKQAIINCNGYKIGQHPETFYESGYGNSVLPAGPHVVSVDDFGECQDQDGTREIARRVAEAVGYVTDETVTQ
ncbi:MAG: hypothetical protein QG623_442 [Patescibacteria group bacterium]|nr:hypothetical protein [Patescibacteria group bacterium]